MSENKRSEGGLHRAARRCGEFVGRHPWPFLLGPLGLSLLGCVPLGLGVALELDLQALFVPLDAGYWDEQVAFSRYLRSFSALNRTAVLQGFSAALRARKASARLPPPNATGLGLTPVRPIIAVPKAPRTVAPRRSFQLATVQVLLSSDAGGGLLSLDLLEKILALDAEVKRSLSVPSRTLGRPATYKDFCYRDCQVEAQNGWVESLLGLYKRNQFLWSTFESQRQIAFAYPVASFLGKRLDISEALPGPIIDRKTKLMSSSRIILLSYSGRVEWGAGRLAAEQSAWARLVASRWSALAEREGLASVSVNWREYDSVVLDVTLAVLPIVPLGMGLVLGFLLLSSWSRRAEDSAMLEALVGLVSVLLSLPVSFGLLVALGVPLNPLVVVTPCICLVIGVDDSFLILAAWRSRRGREVPQRLGAALSEAAVSILLTTLTDLGCVGIGFLVGGSQGIAAFCLFTFTALAADFAFQLTFFPAVLAFQGRREARGGSCRPCKKKEEVVKLPPYEHPVTKFVRNKYAPLLSKPAVQVLSNDFSQMGSEKHKLRQLQMASALLWAAYFGVSLYGCTRLGLDAQLEKFILDSSPFARLFRFRRSPNYADTHKLNVLIRNPPDFTQHSETKQFIAFLEALEALPHSYGSASRYFWLEEVLGRSSPLLSSSSNLSLPLAYDAPRLMGFLDSNGLGSGTSRRLLLTASPSALRPASLVRAFVVPFFYGPQTALQSRRVMQGVRRLCEVQGAPFGALMASWRGGLEDMAGSVEQSFVQTLGLSLLSVTAFLLLLTAVELGRSAGPALVRSLAVLTTSLFSLDLGLAGLMGLWGMSVDFITMVTLLLALGIGVDFTAHVSHRLEHFLRLAAHSQAGPVSGQSLPAGAGGPGSPWWLAAGLGSVALPLSQAGASTLLGLCPLALVGAYVTRAFWKSAVLAVALGLLHGGLFIPLAYRLFGPEERVHSNLRALRQVTDL